MIVLSLGAGVQSSALALMASDGVILPRPDFAIFADTQREPRSVYDHLSWLESILTYPVIRVTAGDLGALEVKTRKSGNTGIDVMIPAYTLAADGTRGMISRQCTKNYKILPIVNKLRDAVGKDALKEWRKNKAVPLVRQLIGISMDEASRMTDNRLLWIKNEYPLVNKNLTRTDCDVWFYDRTGRHAPRSACIFCPFHNDTEWLSLSADSMESAKQYEKDLQKAVAKDARLTSVPFLHPARVPLDEIHFKKRTNYQQKNLLNQFNNECEGMCGV